jgi:hypothetical protein
LIACGVSSAVSSISFIDPWPHAGHFEFSSTIGSPKVLSRSVPENLSE